MYDYFIAQEGSIRNYCSGYCFRKYGTKDARPALNKKHSNIVVKKFFNVHTFMKTFIFIPLT